MPDQTDMPGILLELNQVAEDSGITFDQITPATTATPISGYLAIPITVEFTGNFYDLSDFLYRLRNLVDVRHGALDATGRLFAIDSIEFAEAPPPPGFPQISAHLTIDAFVFGTGTAPTVPPDADDRRDRRNRSHRRHRRDRADDHHSGTRRLRPLPRREPRKPWRRRSTQGQGQEAEDLRSASAASCCSACSPSRCRAR